MRRSEEAAKLSQESLDLAKRCVSEGAPEAGLGPAITGALYASAALVLEEVQEVQEAVVASGVRDRRLLASILEFLSDERKVDGDLDQARLEDLLAAAVEVSAWFAAWPSPPFATPHRILSGLDHALAQYGRATAPEVPE